MRQTLIIAGITSLLVANAALGATSPAEERIGVGLGVTIGAAAGGPVGAILGAAVGAKFGDNFHRKNARIDSLAAELDDKALKVSELEESLAASRRDVGVIHADLRRLQARSRPEFVSLLAAGIEMDLLFRTGEHVLGDETRNKIAQLAGTLASLPDVRIQLDGFADERGDADYNHELSAKRAEHIRAVLLKNGVSEGRIDLRAHGEAATPDGSPDSLAMQRRVSVRLFIDESTALAANPK